MNKKVIIVGSIVLVAGITAYLTRDKWMPLFSKEDSASKSDSSKGGKATSAQFDALVDMAKKTGKDVFNGVSAEKLSQIRDKFTTVLTKEQADKLISIFSKNEKDMIASEKIDLANFFTKISGKKIGS